MADWETWSFLPQAVNEPVSAMACRISSWRRSIRFPETDPMGFRSEERHECDAHHHREGDTAHRATVGEMLAEHGLERGNARSERGAELIRQPGKESAVLRGGELVDVRRNDAPAALHEELNQ